MDLYAAYLNNHCVGISRRSASKERIHPVPAELLITEILNKMGYWSYNEYVDDFPGHKCSENFDIYFDGDYECKFGEDPDNVKNPLVFTFSTINGMPSVTPTMGIFPGQDKSSFNRLFDVLHGGEENCMFLIQPEMSTVTNAWELSDPPRYDELWFCSDWNDLMKPYDKVLKCYTKPDPESGSWFIALTCSMMVFAFIMLTFCKNVGGAVSESVCCFL